MGLQLAESMALPAATPPFTSSSSTVTKVPDNPSISPRAETHQLFRNNKSLVTLGSVLPRGSGRRDGRQMNVGRPRWIWVLKAVLTRVVGLLLARYPLITYPAVLLCHSRTIGRRRHRARAGDQAQQGAELRPRAGFWKQLSSGDFKCICMF